MAVGDIDLDGDLDFVCANDRDSPTLYLNRDEEVPFPAQPIYLSSPSSGVLAVALGDLDRDGYPDIVAGCRENDFVYWNEGGSFSQPVSFGLSRETHDVELGDMDGDGDLDIVAASFSSGNESVENVLYRNDEGAFNKTFEFKGAYTQSVALGDMDGDGDLDVVCGNDGDANVIWLNNAGSLTEGVHFGEGTATRSVVLGDLDGDGDLDIVCGNRSEDSFLYINESGAIIGQYPIRPSGSSIPSCVTGCPTLSVAIGDLNQDGDLDVVSGGDGSPVLVFLNSGKPPFFNEPDWRSAELHLARALSLADFDGDGDVELLSGNTGGQVDAIYRNETPVFAGIHRDVSSEVFDTRAIVAGDLDRDGDIDLVTANGADPEVVYLNDAGVFLKAEEIEAGDRVRDAALADMDGDGYLDLILANEGTSFRGQPSVAYRNLHHAEPGIFSVDQKWITPESHRTYSLATGDVNGDGREDLLLGNGTYSSEDVCTLFLNRSVSGSIHFDTSSWNPRRSVSGSVAIGDLDRDGDRDILGGYAFPCANPDLCPGMRGTLYPNQNGSFPDSHIPWGTTDARPNTLTLGDLDGDSDPDVVVGTNSGKIIYRNDIQHEISDPMATLRTINDTSTQSVLLEDVDADGDLDLVSGNDRAPNSLFLNRGGIEDFVAWRSVSADSTQSLALADLDDDGDLDLVAGNLGKPNTIHDGLRNPPFTGDPGLPKRHLANNGAFLRGVRLVRPPDSDSMTVRFRAYDVESDPIRVIAEYQHDGESAWHAATGRLGPLATSSDGISHEFLWNLEPLPLNDDRSVVLRLRVVESARRVSIMQHVSAYQKDAGRLSPGRPEVALAAEGVSFGSVAWGDTMESSLSIGNRGNEPLRVLDIEAPSGLTGDEFRFDPGPGLEIPPGGTASTRVLLMPRSASTTGSFLTIVTNDPLTPRALVPIQLTVHPLVVRILAPTDSIPLGQDVTIFVAPEPGVVMEGGRILHAPPGTAAAADTALLVPDGTNFRAVIPGEAITETGLEYTIEVFNGPVTVVLPSGAGEKFLLKVLAPESMMALPEPDSTGVYREGENIPILVSLPRGGIFRSGVLHYRILGQESAVSVPLAAFPGGGTVGVDFVAKGVIPGSVVGARGIEYRVEVETAHGRLATPADAVDSYRRIPITISTLSDEVARPGNRYSLFSVPLQVGSITDNLEDDLGPPEPSRWRLFAYDADSLQYVERGAALTEFTPGRGYWLVSRNGGTLDVGPGTTPLGGSFQIELAAGQNLIGNPYAFPVAWSSVLANGLPPAENQVEPPRRWNSTRRCYEMNVKTLLPFQGYWVKNAAGRSMTLEIPAIEAVPDSGETPAASEDGWALNLSAISAIGSDCDNIAGVSEEASGDWDKLDASEPPPGPEFSLSLYFPHDTWDRHSGPYGFDFRSIHSKHPGVESDADLNWRFDVAMHGAYGPVAVDLSVAGIDVLPRGLHAFLIDHDLGRTIALGEENTYSFLAGNRGFVAEGAARFSLIVTSGDFLPPEDLPRQTRLLGGYPNPFRTGTVIRYELAKPGPVRLEIFDIRGRLVKAIEDVLPAPGRYEVIWDGRNSDGSLTPSGVYLYRLSAAGVTDVLKIVRAG